MGLNELLVAPVLAGLVGMGVWFIQSRIDRLHRAKERLVDERRKIYLDTLEPIVRTLAGIKDPKEFAKAQKQIVSFDYKRTALEFNLIGSDEVVRSFNQLMQHFYQAGSDGVQGGEQGAREMLRLWGRLILAIRKNVGEPATKLDEIDMLEAQISDIRKYLEA